MKKVKSKLLISCLTTLLMGTSLGNSQWFLNPDFEKKPKFTTNVFNTVTATLQNWNWSPIGNYINTDTNSVAYNNIALDAPAVTLQGTNSPYYPAIQGNYSVLLQGGSFAIPQSEAGASISQTGEIPPGTQSIMYWVKQTAFYANETFQMTFNGQPLTSIVTSSTANYSVYAANVSADAGQTGLLQFSVPWQTAFMIDNIQFSDSPIPEPSDISLIAFGIVVFGIYRWWCGCIGNAGANKSISYISK